MNKTHYNTAKVRPPAVAGSFYPASASRLQQDINDYLKQAKQQLQQQAELKPLLAQPPLALIVPHAGYMFSGPIAASAYALLAEWKGRISRVVLLGPVHRVAVAGIALPSVNFF
ncbi:MAG TPA: AmmeMemoRadiSam system protein B, partial [Pseudomonadales bacterium]|nr:AmmeMemoRadiSam system protein B [Pseudomonadales bacterium]